ncbi:MAG: type I 3-dehydroquinate dehydratase [Erysipelotrichaceae bacterium]
MDKSDIRKQLKMRKLPFICTPFVGNNETALRNECNLWKMDTSDIIEWRIDYFDDYQDIDALLDMYETLREELNNAVILITLRTLKQGGKADLSEVRYLEILSALCEYDIDLLDIEDNMSMNIKQKLIEITNQQGILSILSHHNFIKTDDCNLIEKQFLSMADFDPDILKVAYMANCEEDVTSLLVKTKEVNDRVEQALISISMGEVGRASRLNAYQYGSILSFAILKEASAPGQISLKEMKEYYKKPR